MRKPYITAALFWLLTVVFLSAGPASAGVIKGTVKPQGLRTAENVLVYVVKTPDVTVDLSGAKFTMDQKQLTFIPHLLPVLVGSKVSFPNSDQVSHNVFSLSSVKKFNLGSYKPGHTETVLFDQPGTVELRCDVHQEMNAYIMVLKNPYFSVTDKDGQFTLPDQRFLETQGIQGVPPLPPGSYTVKTWHEKLGSEKIKVDVPAEGEAVIELKPKRGAPGVLYKH